ncbi:MAG: phosphopantetheine-binding protein [Clostridium sp.]|jgi:acyl carrier protein|nr:phosphopantetheine-binding protein [Clostridium sp.]
MSTILDSLRQSIAQVLCLDPDEILLEDTFDEDLGADSLDVFQIIELLEEEFDIEITAELAQTVTTVEEAAELILKLCESKA